MTKVPSRSGRIVLLARRLLIAAAFYLLTGHVAFAQSPQTDSHCPQTTADLYARIRTVGLDHARVYHVRGASIIRPNLNLTFDDGTLVFSEDICGRITGAFFSGDGEILIQPPNRTERASLTLFTGAAILEEQFSSAYLRFNDDTADLLQPFLSPTSEMSDSFKEWDDASRRLAEYDALRLFLDFSHFLPTSPTSGSKQQPSSEAAHRFPPLLHLHLVGQKLGAFEVFWDAAIAEPLWVGQLRTQNNVEFFNIWTSFAPSTAGESSVPPRDDASITAYHIQASVQPPTELKASSDLNLHIRNGGERALLFELSRYLKVDSVESDGHPLDFIQNPALQGTQLERRGNDLVAVVFPAELPSGYDLKLRFRYAGDVLSDAGNGLLYVGARGTWYPNFGLSPASFDMEFRYPAAWTLIATGKRSSHTTDDESIEKIEAGEKTTHWVSERPIPIAGFNLGKYVRAEAKAGKVVIEAYSTKGVEKTFPKAPGEVIQPQTSSPHSRLNPNFPVVITQPPPPSPARDLEATAGKAANAITTFSQWFGPYPYSSLALTQMPGDLSQGWPGLIFLSSLAFLSGQEQAELNIAPETRLLNSQVLIHETAHQWWGDLILWKTYHDQWISEALANYSALLMLEKENPAGFHQVMDKYRKDLLSKNKDGEWLRDAGPVTLGQRLVSSRFPQGYEAITYERGTWLFHMLRTMLLDSQTASARHETQPNSEEPFFRALRKVRDRYAGKGISTRELIQVFEEELPRPLWYRNPHKLDWFVDSWIDGTAIPKLETRDIHISNKPGAVTVSGFIVQKDAPENLVTAVPVYGEISSNAMIFLGEVLADGPETSFHLTAPASVRKILLDPKRTILSALD